MSHYRTTKLARRALLLLGLFALTLGGCTTVVDLDRFETEPFCGLDARLDGMTDFAGMPIRIEFANEANERVALVQIEGAAPDADGSIELAFKRILPRAGRNRALIFVDTNADGQYTPDFDNGVDVSWQRAVECGSTFAFEADDSFADLSEGPPEAVAGTFTLSLTGFDVHPNQTLELVVFETATRHTVGYYRLGSITADAFDVVLPNILVPGVEYTYEYYADLNRSGGYDGPPIDHAWRKTVIAGDEGVAESFVHAAPFDALTQF